MSAPRTQRRRPGWGVAIGTAAVLGLLIGVAAWWLLPVSYTAVAQSYVSTVPPSNAQEDPFAASTFVLQRMPTYAELATSSGVLQAVAAGTGQSADGLAAKITVTTPPQSVLLNVSVKDASPETAQRIAAAVVVEQAKAVVAVESAQNSTASTPIRVTVIEQGRLLPELSRPLALARNAIGGLVIGGGLMLALAVLVHRPPSTLPEPVEVMSATAPEPPETLPEPVEGPSATITDPIDEPEPAPVRPRRAAADSSDG